MKMKMTLPEPGPRGSSLDCCVMVEGGRASLRGGPKPI
jgi:hypothetical protein